MPTLFHYGPYTYVGYFPPGAQHSWGFGPWPWYAKAVVVTADPIQMPGQDRSLSVTSVTFRAAPNGDRFLYCTVRNVGIDPVNYSVWIGGVAA